MKHNKVRYITVNLLSEVCLDVAVDPMLNKLTCETYNLRSTNVLDGARLYVSARGVWMKYQRAFFYIRVFYPVDLRYQGQNLRQSYITNKKEKSGTTMRVS